MVNMFCEDFEYLTVGIGGMVLCDIKAAGCDGYKVWVWVARDGELEKL